MKLINLEHGAVCLLLNIFVRWPVTFVSLVGINRGMDKITAFLDIFLPVTSFIAPKTLYKKSSN